MQVEEDKTISLPSGPRSAFLNFFSDHGNPLPVLISQWCGKIKSNVQKPKDGINKCLLHRTRKHSNLILFRRWWLCCQCKAAGLQQTWPLPADAGRKEPCRITVAVLEQNSHLIRRSVIWRSPLTVGSSRAQAPFFLLSLSSGIRGRFGAGVCKGCWLAKPGNSGIQGWKTLTTWQ